MTDPSSSAVLPVIEVAPLALADVADLVPLQRPGDADPALARVLPYVIHDGWCVPTGPDPDDPDRPWPGNLQAWCRTHAWRQRDWGAEGLARGFGEALGVGSYFRVRLARSVLDFGRLADFTWAVAATHLQRRALPHRLVELLPSHPELAGLLTYYDEIWRRWTAAVKQRLAAGQRAAPPGAPVAGPVLIGIHTYDATDAHGAERPAACLLYRPEPGPDAEALPTDLFDPLFPRHLADFTADRLLANRIALELERARLPVAHHEVYHLPAGSVEVRSQVWLFFQSLRERLLRDADPARAELGHNQALWRVLMEVTGRDATAVALRRKMRGTSRRGRNGTLTRAYAAVRQFVAEHPAVVADYQHSIQRPSSMVIEIRKDILVEGRGSAAPPRLRGDCVARVGAVLAEAVRKYVHRDQPVKADGAHRWWAPPPAGAP